MNIKTAKILLANGFENVFVIDPPSDRNFILVSSSGGYGQNGIGDTCLSNPTLQIMVANTDYLEAKTIINNMKKLLIGLSYQEINATLARLVNLTFDNAGTWDSGEVWDQFFYEKDKLVGYQLQSDELEAGVDEQLRHRITINFMIWQNNF